MKIQFCFCITSPDEECKVVVEVACSEKPRIKVGDQFAGVYPIENYDILKEKSSLNWKDCFLVGPGPDKSVSVYGGNPRDIFSVEFPEIIEE